MDTLELFSSIRKVGKFIVVRVDGIYALILSIGYISWTFVLLTRDDAIFMDWTFLLGLFFMPVLFILTFMSH